MRRVRFTVALLALFFSSGVVASEHQLLSFEGKVDVAKSGGNVWEAAVTNMTLKARDRVRTAVDSRAQVRLSTRAILPVSELTVITLGGEGDSADAAFELQVGRAFFLGNDKPGKTRFRSRSVGGAVRGTEFHIEVAEDGTTTLSLFDGIVELSNERGELTLNSGQGAVVEIGKAPELRPLLETRRGVQWYLYYPAIVAPEDFATDSEAAKAYSRGDLAGAARLGGESGLLRSGTALSVGQVSKAEAALKGIDSEVADAIRLLVAVVTQPTNSPPRREWTTASGWLAESYRSQAALDLPEALAAARKAVSKSANFGAGWIRVAELEFSFGRIGAANVALERGTEFSPMNAQGKVLKGFLLAAEKRFADAQNMFDRAIELDGALGNAWLGRGLVRMRRGDAQGGFLDLQTAAALDSQRSVTRSYLAKALREINEPDAVEQELKRAMALDPNDPTAWLYRALIGYENHRLSEAISDLEESARRNENRAVYRSRMLLDQDAAVRSAKLANIYELAGMSDVARRESSRAVMFDYANYSSHLNLASSFNAARDPTRFSLRNETVWFNEHLLASLLAPTDSAPLSQALSQNEYSQLFARNRVGFTSSSEVFSYGDIRHMASQYGNFDRFSYALDLDSEWLSGPRPNQELERIEFFTRAKIAITPNDSFFLLTKYQDYDSGDNFQHAFQTNAHATSRLQEWQTPIVMAGFHHEWNPGSHTLFLGGRLENEQHFSDQAGGRLVAFSFPLRNPVGATFDIDARNSFEIYTAEANHILESERHTTIFGGRFQKGDFEAASTLFFPASPATFGGTTTSTGDGDFGRRSVYLYHTWEIISDLRLTGGVSYDDITSPRHYRRPPFEPGETHRNHWSPKVALIYAPDPLFTLRGMYAESLAGASYDESVTLEPTQLAGFPQAFRTLMSESLVGSVEVPRHDAAGLGFDFKLPTRTYLGLEGIALKSKVDQRMGIFDFNGLRQFEVPPRPNGIPSATDRLLRYEERSARLIVNQIVGEELFAEAHYQFTRADLDSSLPTIVAPATFGRTTSDRADLHRVGTSLLYQRADGWFARAQATYLRQDTIAFLAPAPPSDDVAFFDLYVGWRFPKLKGDITFGVLNIGDSDYKLYPLTAHEEFPRERTFYMRFRLNL